MIIAVDFDGTLSLRGYPYCEKPNMSLIRRLVRLKNEGSEIILHTCRYGEDLDEAVEFCERYGLRFDAVNENLPKIVKAFGGDTRKVVADIYIDDKGVTPEIFMKEKADN